MFHKCVKLQKYLISGITSFLPIKNEYFVLCFIFRSFEKYFSTKINKGPFFCRVVLDFAMIIETKILKCKELFLSVAPFVFVFYNPVD